MFWAFKLSFVVEILTFLPWRIFGLLLKNWAIFSNLLVTLVVSLEKSFLGQGFVRVMSYYDETLLA
jgi:hypothetical protein